MMLWRNQILTFDPSFQIQYFKAVFYTSSFRRTACVTLLIAHVVKRLSLSSLHSVYNERICGVYHIDLQHSFMMSGTERNRYHIHLCQIQHHYIATLMISECLSQHGLHGLGCYMHVRWMNKDDHLIHGMSIILAWFNRFDSIREQRIAAMYLYWYRISSSCSNLRY